ncbi:MAG TPA: phage terminase large subunit [Terriglobales bacterium]|nr:phage terminase large subunit [Terriglobales bacterium]
MTPDQYFAVLRRDFYSFLERSFTELNPQTDFAHNWHIEVMAQELERCLQGDTRRLIVNLPPRSLKSHSASVAFVAWLLGHKPSAQVICASYAQDLADKHAIDCRALMNSSFYRQIFPTRLSSEKRAISDFLTTARGCRKATSVGGVLTGRGADFIVIDDPLQPDKALSDVRRNAVNDWYDNTLCSRLNHKLTGCIVIVMQRLHEDDLVGHVLDIERRQGLEIEPKWKLLRFPAIAEADEQHVVTRLNKTFTYQRRAGEALHPQREPLEILAQLRETQGEYTFAGQYQQSPAPLGGGMVKRKWFRSDSDEERPERFDLIFQSWDTANKASELSDYSVCTTWGVMSRKSSGVAVAGSGWFGAGGKCGNLYLLNVLRRKMEYPELKRQAQAHAMEWGAKNVLIEDKASGTQLCQELVQEGMHGVTRCESRLEKTMRMHTVTNMIENGFVYLPEKANWLAQYLHELLTFPKGKHDDQADSTSQALNWVKSRLWEPGIVTFYREEAEKLRKTSF